MHANAPGSSLRKDELAVRLRNCGVPDGCNRPEGRGCRPRHLAIGASLHLIQGTHFIYNDEKIGMTNAASDRADPDGIFERYRALA